MPDDEEQLNVEDGAVFEEAPEGEAEEELVEEPLSEDDGADDILARWEFDEYPRHERSKRWYIIAALIGAALVIYSLYTNNFIFGVIVILIALIYFLYDLHEPPKIECVITAPGIQVGHKMFKHRDLHHFWIVYKPGEVQSLYLRPRVWSVPQLAIPLDEQDPLQIREILLPYVRENLKEDDEPVTDFMARVFKL